MRIVDEWRWVCQSAWSIRVAAFWGAMCGLLLVWPALAESIPIFYYVVGGIVIATTIAVARFLKQPGIDN